MFVELIATFIAGIACAGLAMLLNIVTGRRLPRWIMPIAAGAGMLAMTLSNEYTWFSRTSETLPEGVEVALTVEEQSWLRPWTQIWPYTKRFAAVDRTSLRRHENLPDQRLADAYFFGRWSAIERRPMLFDCATNRAALLSEGASFGADGTVAEARWSTLSPQDGMLKVACRE